MVALGRFFAEPQGRCTARKEILGRYLCEGNVRHEISIFFDAPRGIPQ